MRLSVETVETLPLFTSRRDASLGRKPKNALFASLMQGIFLPIDNPDGIIQRATTLKSAAAMQQPPVVLNFYYLCRRYRK
jgi:hypothetical protein